MIEFSSIKKYIEELDEEIIKLELEIGRIYVWVERLINCETLEDHARRLISEYKEGIRSSWVNDQNNDDAEVAKMQEDLDKYLLEKKEVQKEMKKRGFSKELSIEKWKKKKEKEEKLAEIKKAYPKAVLKSENSTYCTRCDQVTVHCDCHYKDGSLGFGGGIDFDYAGLRCSVCDNKIYESGIGRWNLVNEIKNERRES